MKLRVVRHGETPYTVEARIQGSLPVQLSKKGGFQASHYARQVSERPDRIISSTLERAYETASIIANRLNVEVCFDPRLAERNYGLWQGRLWSEVHQNNPGLRLRWAREGASFSPPGGESIMGVYERIRAFLVDLRTFSYESVIIVAHGGVIQILEGMEMDKSPDEFYNQNGMPPHCVERVFEINELLSYDHTVFL